MRANIYNDYWCYRLLYISDILLYSLFAEYEVEDNLVFSECGEEVQ